MECVFIWDHPLWLGWTYIKYHQIWKHRRDTHNCSSHHNCSSRSRSPYNRFLLHPHSCIRNLSPCEQPSTKENNASNLEFPKSIPLKKYVRYSQLHNATNPSNSGNSLHHKDRSRPRRGSRCFGHRRRRTKSKRLAGHIGGTCSHDNLLLRKKTDVGHIEWGWFNEDLMDLMLTLSIFNGDLMVISLELNKFQWGCGQMVRGWTDGWVDGWMVGKIKMYNYIYNYIYITIYTYK